MGGEGFKEGRDLGKRGFVWFGFPWNKHLKVIGNMNARQRTSPVSGCLLRNNYQGSGDNNPRQRTPNGTCADGRREEEWKEDERTM